MILSTSPHFHSGTSTRLIMQDILIALIPAVAASIVFFGWRALVIELSAVISAVAAEHITQKVLRKKTTIDDLSAVVTGLLLALCVSSFLPWWVVSLGAVFAIVVAKMLFGGLGFNIFNPALMGRAFLLASYPVFMTTWFKPFDSVTGATPLGILKEHSGTLPSLWSLFWGNVGGSLGETSALALLLGAAYLFYKKIIDWRIPGSYLLTVALFAVLTGQNIGFHLLAGGLMLGAFFMATDYTTSPMSTKGKIIFGMGCGIVTMVIRLYGGYPEGVCYSILFMNMFVPLLDRVK